MPIAHYKQAHTICPVNLQTFFFFFKEKKNKKKKYQLNRKLGILSSRDSGAETFLGRDAFMFCTQAVQVMYLMCVFMMCKWCIECIHGRYTNDVFSVTNGHHTFSKRWTKNIRFLIQSSSYHIVCLIILIILRYIYFDYSWKLILSTNY
jgi:hypothetical protein